MEVYYLFLACVLFTTVASYSLQSAVSEHTNPILAPDTQGQNCQCENGRCVTDNHGNSKCVCQPGFALQDEFTCQPCDCGPLGNCIFVLAATGGDQYQYEKRCVCDEGKAEKDGECVECFCGDNSACDFDNGEKNCFCIDGYSEKDGVCTECDCGFNGDCEYENGIKMCACDEGYLEYEGVCEECDCGDNGTCSFENSDKTCKCEPGFSVDNGICEPCDCGSNSVNCALDDGVKQCECKDRYADRYGTCEECYCGDYTKSCNFNENQKTCSCLEGYVQKGEMCELGCSDQHPCQNGGYCKEGFCFCLNGTRGEFCEVVDECSTLCPNQEDITCDYDVGSQKAYCKCLDDNLRYNPDMKQCRRTCEDDTSCKNQGKCTSTSRDKFCDCLEGTAGEFCEEIPVCNGVDCGPDAYCVFDPSTKSSACACKDSSLHYDAAKSQCRRTCEDDKSCQNQGKCTGTSQNMFCECLEGTAGDFCEEIPVCSGVDCGTDAYCVFNPSTKSADCACKDSNLHYDATKSQCRRTCEDDKSCKNQGKCTGTSQHKFCDCLDGTTGDFCEEIPVCKGVDCGPDAYCAFNPSTKSANCACKDPSLNYDINKRKCRRTCEDDKSCKNQGKCTGTSQNKFCECLEGTAGDFCEEIPVCKGVNCGSDAYCVFNPSTKSADCACKDSSLHFDVTKRKCRRTCEGDKSCKNQGKCTGTSRNKFCDCLEGTTGDFCEEVPACKGMDCGSDAVCVINPSTKRADCACKNPGLHYDATKRQCRKFCEKDKECSNGGKCSGKGSNRFCECLPGTRGDRCEIIDDCVSGRIKCKGQGTFCDYDVKNKKASCVCKEKHKDYDFGSGKCRRSCEKDKECDNGAKCHHNHVNDHNKGGGDKFCECHRGTQGDRCEIIDDCASGRLRCRGDRAYCDFDVRSLKAVCRCRDKKEEYDSRNGRCRRGHHHHHHSSEESDDSDEDKRSV